MSYSYLQWAKRQMTPKAPQTLLGNHTFPCYSENVYATGPYKTLDTVFIRSCIHMRIYKMKL